MPTPFYHLDIAESLLNHPALPDSIRHRLLDDRSAFLLGNTAPDVQVISRQKRQATHFFSFPFNPAATPPWEHMLASFPVLVAQQGFPRAQAAFLAGYLCHLQADWYWVRDIFLPAFGPEQTWGVFTHRLYLHNVLRAYLDREVLPGLQPDVPEKLHTALPDRWLPFTADRFLLQWRDFLATQLEPGAKIATVEVLAARQGLPPAQFYRLLDSEEQMDTEIFIFVSRKKLEDYRQKLIQANLRLITAYLPGTQPDRKKPLNLRTTLG